MVDAESPEIEFTIWNKVKVKEKLLSTIYNPEFHFLDLKFQTLEIQSFWANSKIFQTFFNSKACLGGLES